MVVRDFRVFKIDLVKIGLMKTGLVKLANENRLPRRSL